MNSMTCREFVFKCKLYFINKFNAVVSYQFKNIFPIQKFFTPPIL